MTSAQRTAGGGQAYEAPASSLLHHSSHYFHTSLLQKYLQLNHILAGKSVHSAIVKAGLHLRVFLANNLLTFYSKTGRMSDAHHLFDEMPSKNPSTWNILISSHLNHGSITSALDLFRKMPHPDPVSWTCIMVGYNGMGYFYHAINMFVEMISSTVMPSHFTLTNILSSCASINSLPIGRKVHSFVIKLGFSSFVPVVNSLLNMYSKTGDIRTAELLFNRMTVKNTSSWNTMMTLLLHSGHLDDALFLFSGIPEKDLVSWNSMISGYCHHGMEVKALHMFSAMLNSSYLRPDKFTLASILSACANLGELKTGKQIHSMVIRMNFDSCEPVINALISMYSKTGSLSTAKRVIHCGTPTVDLNVVAFTALLDGYIKLGDVTPAREVFDSTKNRDVVAWTAMIVGYVQNGLYSQAEELFRKMLNDGPEPNCYTLSAMLSVCATMSSLSHGRQVHAFALRLGEASSTSVGNALISMYAKSGCIEAAMRIFSLGCWKKDGVSWSSMILALAQHGIGEAAVELFEEMMGKGIIPDHITYVGVLSACTHAGLVDKGRSYYSMMQDVHNIKPTSSHCACMVDLLSRAGLLKEAQDFIENMPVEPDVVVWGSLLASCKLHKNLEVANLAVGKLLLIDPNHSGAFSALAGVYASCGKWGDAAKIRKAMKDRHVKKEQGFSWVQVKDRVHVFGVDDTFHPQREEVYNTMDKIWGDIKKMGFRPDVDSVLHDLDDEVKEQMLRHHSEKLAIAFGVMSTPEKTTLRIIKNLRVCNDCHNAIKFISKLVRREIVVRDATRFHHFKDASCSCRDYW